jgi:hypothetical protein
MFFYAEQSTNNPVVFDPSVLLPTLPPEPMFSGTIRYVGNRPGDYVNVLTAHAAANNGDIIEIRSGYTSVGDLSVMKSVEIRGQDKTAKVTCSFYCFYLPQNVNNIKIRNLTLESTNTVSTDWPIIFAHTMNNTTRSGSSGLWFENLDIKHPKQGIQISGKSWVIKDVKFTCISQNPGTTIRPIFMYGSTGTSFITGNTFIGTPSTRTWHMGSVNVSGFRTGYAGDMVFKGNNFISASTHYLDWNAVVSPGLTTAPAFNSGSLSMWFDSNTFTDYVSAPLSFFSAYARPLSMLDKLYAVNNIAGSRTTGEQKGFIHLDGTVTNGTNPGAPNKLYALGNTFPSTLPSVSGTNVSIVPEVNNFIAVRTPMFLTSSTLTLAQS